MWLAERLSIVYPTRCARARKRPPVVNRYISRSTAAVAQNRTRGKTWMELNFLRFLRKNRFRSLSPKTNHINGENWWIWKMMSLLCDPFRAKLIARRRRRRRHRATCNILSKITNNRYYMVRERDHVCRTMSRLRPIRDSNVMISTKSINHCSVEREHVPLIQFGKCSSIP